MEGLEIPAAPLVQGLASFAIVLGCAVLAGGACALLSRPRETLEGFGRLAGAALAGAVAGALLVLLVS